MLVTLFSVTFVEYLVIHPFKSMANNCCDLSASDNVQLEKFHRHGCLETAIEKFCCVPQVLCYRLKTGIKNPIGDHTNVSIVFSVSKHPLGLTVHIMM